jgi:hypothetical protein
LSPREEELNQKITAYIEALSQNTSQMVTVSYGRGKLRYDDFNVRSTYSSAAESWRKSLAWILLATNVASETQEEQVTALNFVTEAFADTFDASEPAALQALLDSPQKPTVAEQISSSLGRLKDNWAGPGSVAPTDKIIQQVSSVVGHLPSLSKMPSIEVEDDDGTVSLRWVALDRKKSFSLVFRGKGRVTAIFATAEPPASKAWSAEVTDEISLAGKLDEPHIREIIIA